LRIEEVMDVGDVARVHLLRLREESWGVVECVGALDPALPREEKMVLVVSSQFGCPVGCLMCDAGKGFYGNLRACEMDAQIDFLLDTWAGPGAGSCPKLKVQFARMGEPALNPAVLEVLRNLPARHRLPGLMPCIATTAPLASSGWFEELREIKNELFPGGRFQLQLSIQSTSEHSRRRLISGSAMDLRGLSVLCARFFRNGDRKVTLNFAAIEGVPIEPGALGDMFDPSCCLVKLTPLNPTGMAGSRGLSSLFESGAEAVVTDLASALRENGFEVVVSVGLPEEGRNGTSCGQMAFLRSTRRDAAGRPGGGLSA
jgi:23S rRNA (adenine2503-C2)-methyltransferase